MHKFIKSLGKVLAFPISLFLILTRVSLLPVKFVEVWLDSKLDIFINEIDAGWKILKMSCKEIWKGYTVRLVKNIKLESSSGKSIEYLREIVS